MYEIDVGLATVADKILDVHCIGPICDKGIHTELVAVGAVAKKADIHCDSKCEALWSETF